MPSAAIRRKTLYLSLLAVFFLFTIGPTGICFLLFVSLIFFAAFATYLVREGARRRLELRRSFSDWAHRFQFSEGLELAKDSSRFSDESIYADKHAMTNSDVLDPILEQILDNIMRESIDSWYNGYLSDDKLFGASLKRTARRTVIALRTCLSKVDWVPLLTRHIVDDFASHLRLYRKAKERLQIQRELSGASAAARLDDLESVFFDLELEMERSYCRDLVSTSPAYESAYLHDICDILLYLLMPSEDFRSRPLRLLVREVFVSKVFIPLLDKLSDPGFVNRMIVWLLSELPISTDDFVGSLEQCNSVQELEAILESVHDETNSLRSKGGTNRENGNIFAQQLTSLEFAENVIKRRMRVLANYPEQTGEAIVAKGDDKAALLKNRLPSLDLAEDASNLDADCPPSAVHLPITVVLTHQVALAHFVEFLNRVGGQNYIDFYLAIEGFKVSMGHQLRGLSNGETLDEDAHETIREAALFMYKQYLSQEAITRVPLNEAIINKFLARLRNDDPPDMWFEQVQEKVIEILRSEDRFYPTFKKDKLYGKMLDELGIGTLSAATPAKTDGEEEGSSSSMGSLEGIEELGAMLDLAGTHGTGDVSAAKVSVHVEMLGVGHQGRNLFALYNVRVNKSDAGGRGGSSQNVIRRYSDFHTLHNLILAKFPSLRTLSFPGKKTFNNLDQSFLEKRCRALNQYMNCILQPPMLAANPGLEQIVSNFLSAKHYTGRESFPKTMSNAVFNNPIVNGVKAFGTAAATVPSDLIDGIGKMGSELNRAASSVLKGNTAVNKQHGSLHRCRSGSSSAGNLLDSSRVAAHLDENDSAESIPLRVLLLLIDEVFGLRAKNQWFRRRLVALLRQFLNAAVGGSINRRIIDAVNWLTSEEQVAQYLIAFREAFWGDSNGSLSEQLDSQKTRFLARCLMLSAVPDQLRLFIGNSTIQSGVENVSEALQNRHLNRYVVLERLLLTVFPNNHFNRILPQLHSKSPRTKIF